MFARFLKFIFCEVLNAALFVNKKINLHPDNPKTFTEGLTSYQI